MDIKDQLALFASRPVPSTPRDREDEARIEALKQERERLLGRLTEVEQALAELYQAGRRRAARREQWLHSLYGKPR